MPEYNRAIFPGREIATGAAMAVTAASIDISLSLAGEHGNLAALRSIFPPIGAVSAILFVVWTAAWFAVVGPLAARFGLCRTASRVAFAFMTGALTTTADINRYTGHLTDPFNVVLMLLFSIGAGVGSYHATARILRRESFGATVGALFYAFPVAAILAAIQQWHLHYPQGGVVTGKYLIVSAGLVAAGAIFFVVLNRLRNTAWPSRLATIVCLALIPAAPVVHALGVNSPPAASDTAPGPIRHVVMIIIDTMRADHMSCYSDDATPTPNLDALAADGVRFDHAISASPWTLPAVSSIMTAVPPRVHRVLEENSVLPSVLLTLAERMRQAGYLTGAVGYNPVLDPTRAVSQGFWEYDWFPKQTTDTSVGTSILKRIFAERYRSDASTKSPYRSGDRMDRRVR